MNNIINIIDFINNNGKLKKLNIYKSFQIYSNKINKNIINNCFFYKNLSCKFKLNKQLFNSSSSSIIKHPFVPDRYIINMRIINYKLNILGYSNLNNKKCITLNKICVLDKYFNVIFTKYIFPNDYESKYVGIEDIRLFNFKKQLYFIGSYYNKINDKVQIVSNTFNLNDNTFEPIIINPSFETTFNWEKNWVFFEKNDELYVIYKWNPIFICKIDYANKKLHLIKSISDLPAIFSNFRGSTNGLNYNNKIYFIVHQQNKIINEIKGYTHNFVVFDNNMNLIGYSKSFNFENKLIEFCIGLELSHRNRFIITYSSLDSSTKLIVLSPEFVDSLIIHI